MILHLAGRPCRRPDTGGFENTTPDWKRVSCGDCRQTKKYARLADADIRTR